jgi:uncharacterized protein (DUF934 family)
MPTLIDRHGVRDDRFVSFVGHDTSYVPGSAVLLPLGEWRERRERWLAHGGPIGVVLGPADDPLVLREDIDRLALIAVEFPSFNDGRGYSTARIVRGRLGYRGELRATGDVMRDVLFLLARCGFDSFALRDDQDLADALEAFADFSETYQAAADGRALFERRDGDAQRRAA